MTCDMERDCTRPISHMDEKGYIYCREHGLQRRNSGIYCRALRRWELKLIRVGEPVPSYQPITMAEHMRRQGARKLDALRRAYADCAQRARFHADAGNLVECRQLAVLQAFCYMLAQAAMVSA